MKPTIPPPVPACQGFAACVVMGAASASMNSESWRSTETAKLNMLAGLTVFVRMIGGANAIFLCCCAEA